LKAQVYVVRDNDQQQRLWIFARMQMLVWSAMTHGCMCSVQMLAIELSETEKQAVEPT